MSSRFSTMTRWPGDARLRIGELSRRVGESPELLRAWEKRYGIVSPERTPGGLRLYSEDDERRILAMQRHIGAGLSAAEAARLARADDADGHSSAPGTLRGDRAGARAPPRGPG